MKRLALAALTLATVSALAACEKIEPKDARPAAPGQASAPATAPGAGERGRGFLSYLAVSEAQAQPAKTPAPLDPAKIDTKKLTQAIRDNLEENLPPGAQLQMQNLRPAEVPGLAAADLSISVGGKSQSVPVYFTTDGRFVTLSPLYRLTGADADKIPGFKAVTFQDPGGDSKEILVSDDGSMAAFGEFWDSSVDAGAARMKKLTLTDTPVRGKKGAKVVMVEISDFQCPFCARGYNTMQDQIYPVYKDKVEFHFKHLPLSFHDWARPAAIASACAGRQDDEKFWKAYSYFFQNQRGINQANIEERVRDMAQKTGLNQRQFMVCYQEQQTAPQIERDMQEAASVGISGTPGYMINGRKIGGALPFDQFKAILDEEIAKAGGR